MNLKFYVKVFLKYKLRVLIKVVNFCIVSLDLRFLGGMAEIPAVLLRRHDRNSGICPHFCITSWYWIYDMLIEYGYLRIRVPSQMISIKFLSGSSL